MSRSFVFVAALLASAGVGLFPGCLELRETRGDVDDEARCATCHGDPERDGDYLLKAAPPRDLWGVDRQTQHGVGAHQIHLRASQTHAALKCTECHVVPESVEASGHADDDRPAEIVFGDLAKTGDRDPSYDPDARRCSDTWCHREADAVWTLPLDSSEACGTCHGLPPAEPHPQSQLCSVCHSEVVNDAMRIVARDKHVNGRVEVQDPGCTGCHGSGADPAPPPDTQGNSAATSPGVGAHRVHLEGTGTSRPLACEECHRVPQNDDGRAHPDGVAVRVALRGVAASQGRSPRWDRESSTCTDSWCHGPGPGVSQASPEWTATADLDCQSCHGTPPPLPHPQSDRCSVCHGEVVDAARRIIAADRHVDGTVDVNVEQSCDGCHGDLTGAPPPDTLGRQSSSDPGVGAHRAHLTVGDSFRVVPCDECHLVPDEVLAPGHLDSPPPAEVVFSGVALSFGAEPSYENGSCANTYCHGAVFPDGDDSGGSFTEPTWTLVDGSQTDCGGCHALPPTERPHPDVADCAYCHRTMNSDNTSFRRPELHADGKVDFAVP